jgi:hypothetical protein
VADASSCVSAQTWDVRAPFSIKFLGVSAKRVESSANIIPHLPLRYVIIQTV